MESALFKVITKDSNKLISFFRIIYPNLKEFNAISAVKNTYDYVSLIQISPDKFQESQESLELITYNIVMFDNFDNNILAYKRYLYEIQSCKELMRCMFTHFMYIENKSFKSRTIDSSFKDLLITDLLASDSINCLELINKTNLLTHTKENHKTLDETVLFYLKKINDRWNFINSIKDTKEYNQCNNDLELKEYIQYLTNDLLELIKNFLKEKHNMFLNLSYEIEFFMDGYSNFSDDVKFVIIFLDQTGNRLQRESRELNTIYDEETDILNLCYEKLDKLNLKHVNENLFFISLY